MPLCNNMEPGWRDRVRICYIMKFSDQEPDGLSVWAKPMTQEMTAEEQDIYVKEGHDFCSKILRILFFIMWRIENRKKTTIESEKRNTPVNTEKKKVLPDKTKSKEDATIFLLDDLVEHVAKNNLYPKFQKGHRISCPCWSVRGHYRTYKSGKKVFVKPFEKGKERGKVAAKQHVYTI